MVGSGALRRMDRRSRREPRASARSRSTSGTARRSTAGRRARPSSPTWRSSPAPPGRSTLPDAVRDACWPSDLRRSQLIVTRSSTGVRGDGRAVESTMRLQPMPPHRSITARGSRGLSRSHPPPSDDDRRRATARSRCSVASDRVGSRRDGVNRATHAVSRCDRYCPCAGRTSPVEPVADRQCLRPIAPVAASSGGPVNGRGEPFPAAARDAVGATRRARRRYVCAHDGARS